VHQFVECFDDNTKIQNVKTSVGLLLCYNTSKLPVEELNSTPKLGTGTPH
jgi:hypothetical protein